MGPLRTDSLEKIAKSYPSIGANEITPHFTCLLHSCRAVLFHYGSGACEFRRSLTDYVRRLRCCSRDTVVRIERHSKLLQAHGGWISERHWYDRSIPPIGFCENG